MKYLKGAAVLAVAMLLTATFGAGTRAATLEFELGLTSSVWAEGQGWEDLNDLNPGYGGLLWGNGFEITTEGLFTSAYNNTGNFPSSSNAAYNGDGIREVEVLASASPRIKLQNAWFRGWGANDADQWYTSTNVAVEGFLNGSSVGLWTTDLSSAEWILLVFGDTVVDKFTITSSGDSRWWLMDDLSVQAVPLPPALWLFGSGLAAIGFMGRRRRRATPASA